MNQHEATLSPLTLVLQHIDSATSLFVQNIHYTLLIVGDIESGEHRDLVTDVPKNWAV